MLIKRALVFLVSGLLFLSIKGQPPQEWYQHYFDSLIGINHLGLIEGYEYEYPQLAKGTHAFLWENYWLSGDINYKGSTYYKVPLRYDLYNQQIIIKKETLGGNLFSVSLNKEDIDWIGIRGEVFMRIDYRNFWLFQEHFKGSRIALYELHKKKQEVDQVSLTFKYKSDNAFFVQIKNQLFPFKKKKDVIKHFTSHKTEVNQFIKSNKLEINSKNLDDVKTLLLFCESL